MILCYVVDGSKESHSYYLICIGFSLNMRFAAAG